MGYKCPYCKMVSRDDGYIRKDYYLSHDNTGYNNCYNERDSVCLILSKCANCDKVSVHMHPLNRFAEYSFSFSYPPEGTVLIPEYIPEAIREDYMEARAILENSPKSAATLARRCLQGMIHDFWGIKEKNLNAELSTLKGKVPVAQWNAIDALRKVGNIGAHMESDINVIVDVEPGEAESLLKLIELLIDKWYIARHEEEELLADIVKIGDKKEAERKSGTGGGNSDS